MSVMVCFIVSCSAGVGRTGAFIALDCLLDQADAEGVVDVFALTNQMRKDRLNMIQTVVSIHICMRLSFLQSNYLMFGF